MKYSSVVRLGVRSGIMVNLKRPELKLVGNILSIAVLLSTPHFAKLCGAGQRESNLTVLVCTRDPDTAKRMAPHIEVSQEEMRLLCQNSVYLFGSVHLCWISICKSEKTENYTMTLNHLKRSWTFKLVFVFHNALFGSSVVPDESWVETLTFV